jgi:DNA replication protein DnaC
LGLPHVRFVNTPKNKAQLAAEHRKPSPEPDRRARRSKLLFLDSFACESHKFGHWRGPCGPRELLQR